MLHHLRTNALNNFSVNSFQTQTHVFNFFSAFTLAEPDQRPNLNGMFAERLNE